MPVFPGTPEQPDQPKPKLVFPGTPAATDASAPAAKPTSPASSSPGLGTRFKYALNGILRGALKPVRAIPGDIGSEFKGGIRTMQQASDDAEKSALAGLLPSRAGLKQLSGAAQALASPITGPARALVGDPIRTNIPGKGGELTADTAETLATIFGPGAIAKTLRSAATNSGLIQGAKDVGKTIEKIFSPTTVSDTAKTQEGIMRESLGEAERATQTTKAELDNYAKTINALDPAEKQSFLDYVEGRGKGATLSDPALQPVADSLKKAFDQRMNELKKLPSTAQASFVEDYFPHFWQDQKAAQDFLASRGTPKQGSGRNLKERVIPTIADGLAAGLKPAFESPLDATMKYVTNMDRYIATNKIFDTMRENGTAKFFTPGKQPSGWVPLEGRLSQKAAPMGEEGARIIHAYAPEDAARIYNNFISRGFHGVGQGEFGDLYDMAQKGVNSITAAELSFSMFHAATMAQEAIVNDVANAVGQSLRGDFLKAGKSILKSPAAPVSTYRMGKRFEQQYLGQNDFGPDFRNIVDLGTKAGMRAVGKDRSYGASAMGSFWNSFKKGTLGSELKSSGQRAMQSPIMGVPKELSTNLGRLMDTVAQPLFDKYIPRIKNGAFYSNMKDWIEAHPNSSQSEQMAVAREIWDSIDNRFGELVQDDLFWNRMLKQSLQLMTRSVGWDLGTLREIAGGAADIARGRKVGGEWSPRAKYVIALPIVTGLVNATAQYLKTGKKPQSVSDLYAYQTGGKNPDGTPERAMVPGYMRDVLGYANDPLGEIGNKIATGPKMIYDLLSNKDYRGLPIADPTDKNLLDRIGQYLAYIGQAYIPISAKTMRTKAGSGITLVERGLGIRPAPNYIQNPERTSALKERQNIRLEKAKRRSDQRIEDQYNQ